MSLNKTYAVDALARITLVGVFAEVLALCNAQGVDGDDLVESYFWLA
jgi:hypothetical protein